MLSLGHPILGDYFYGQDEDDLNDAYSMADRLNLHACELHVDHPITGQRMQFFSKAPF